MHIYDKKSLIEAILEEAPIMCYVSDAETYDLLYMNIALKNKLGIKKSDDSYIGLKCYGVLQGKKDICEFCNSGSLEKGKAFELNFLSEKLHQYFSIKNMIFEIDGKKIRVEYIQDNSKTDKELETLNKKLSRELTLVECAKTLSEARDVKVAIDKLLLLVGKYYNSHRAYTFEKDESGLFLNNTYEWCIENVEGIAPQINNLKKIPMKERYNWFEKFEKHGGFNVFIDDIRPEMPNEYQALIAQNIRNVTVVPLVEGNEILGFVGVDDPTENISDISLLNSVSFFIVDYLRKRKEVKALNIKLAKEEVLVKCAQSLSADKDKKGAIDNLLSYVGEFYDADRTYITEKSDDELLVINTYEWCKEGIESQIKNLQNIPYSTYSHWFDSFEKCGEYVMTSINEIEKFAADYKLLTEQGIESMITVPLIDKGKIIGCIAVDDPHENKKDIGLLHSVALFIVDDLKKREFMNKLEYMVYSDSLTGVWNRYKYSLEVKGLTAVRQRVGIIYADIDGLRKKNDDYGNEYGDSLLVKTAESLVKYFPDEIYRVGGDEFVILCKRINIREFNECVENLRIELNALISVSVSVGSTWCNNTTNLLEHIEYADELMYINKQEYHKHKYLHSKNFRMNVAYELQEQIAKGQFTIELQLKVALQQNNRVIGAEALVRRIDIDGQLISPEKFIKVYETDGIVRHIDFFVLDSVCKMLREWLDTGLKPIPISVNFSRITIMEYNIAKSIKEVCDNYNIPSNLIVIELTERISNIKADSLVEILKLVKQEGFKVSLDDFGAEYANLAILAVMNFDEIKFDKSLVDDIEHNSVQRTLLKHLIQMCNEIDNTCTTAEGVETEEQMKILFNAKCEVAQGYYFDKPISVSKFEKKYLCT